MKNLTKTFSILLIATILCISSFTCIFASVTIPDATSDFYVNDFANVFTDEEENTLMNNAVKLATETDGVQVVVSTIESLEGDTVENYAYNMYNKYGIGKDDMGLLILLSTGDRKIRVEIGRTMEGYINDSKAGRFIDKYAIPYLKDNKFNEGLISLQSAFVKEITNNVLSEKTLNSTFDSLPSVDWSNFLLTIGIIVILALFAYIILLIARKIKKRKALISELNKRISNLEKSNSNLTKQNIADKNASNKIIDKLKQDKNTLTITLSQTKNELTTLKDRYARILKIYPDANAKVDEMLKQEQIEKDKSLAASVDSHISEVISLSPNKDIIDKVFSVMSEYKNLTKEQRAYIKNDFTKLKNLYVNSLKLKEDYEKKLEEERIRKLTEQRKKKADSVTKQILAVIAGIGIARANDLYELNEAKDLYEYLDSETKRYVDDSVISDLNSLIAAARRDKEEEEEEERRRRQASYHSSSSSFSGGGFGGFGGNSGGGGASRGF